MKKCGNCGLETEDNTVQCYQCGRDNEFFVKDGEGKMANTPPPLPPPQLPASAIVSPLNPSAARQTSPRPAPAAWPDERDVREAAQVKKVKSAFQGRLSAATPKAWVTFGLVVVNAVIFVALLAAQQNGGSISTSTLTAWGADFGPLTVRGHQWWRLLTACFLHVSILHAGFNMFALIQAGRLTERLFGNWFFLLIYLGCGIIASLTSEWFNPKMVSVGASGAVFGVYGALLGYLAREHGALPGVVVSPVWKGAAVFILWNVASALNNAEQQIVGTATMNIDFAAHGGGLVAGLLFGFLAARPLDLQERQRLTFNRAVTLTAAIAVLATMLVVLVITQYPRS